MASTETNKKAIDKLTIRIMRIILEDQNGYEQKASLQLAKESEGSEMYARIRAAVKSTINSKVKETRRNSSW
jgi:hypothetical protein